jgi:hypothetical protein
VAEETDWLSARGPQLPELPSVGTDLRAVIPVASRDLGDGVRVVSVEIYDKGVVVRSLVAPPPDKSHPPTPGQAFELSDDAGTRYRHFSFGSFGHKEAVRGEALYVPAPPDRATTLTVAFRGQRLSVELP